MRSRVPVSNGDTALDADTGFSWHTDNHLLAFAARSGLFWSATVRAEGTRDTEAPGPSEASSIPFISMPVIETALGNGLVAAAALAPSTTSIEPLVMASLCDLLYDEPGTDLETRLDAPAME